MDLQKWMLFLWALSFTDLIQALFQDDEQVNFNSHEAFDKRQNDKYPSNIPSASASSTYPYIPFNGNNIYPPEEADISRQREREDFRRCSDKMERALDTIRRRHVAKERMFNLNGFSLHQQLRSAPFDMYVTDMRVRLPPSKPWVKVQKCNFNPINPSLDTRLQFNDLTISGKVNLFNDAEVQREPIAPMPEESCNMILRLRKAGIGFHTEPIRHERGQFNVRTDSHFLEPGFISVYAYGCEPGTSRRRNSIDNRGGGYDNVEELDEEMSREMEDIFLRGIRSLLTSYMQKELQPAIKETLMKNMGYTVSYG